MKKLNCWEFKRCGRQAGGNLAKTFGVCPASTETRLDGIHEGKNAGRACWVVAGTLCDDRSQGTFVRKFAGCGLCDFYNKVKEEEGEDFVPADVLHKKLK